MSGLLVVLPVLVAETADCCTRSILRDDSAFGIPPSDVLIVDNSRDGFAAKYEQEGFRYYRDPDSHQLGVARSWNIGARAVLAEGQDYLVLLSASMLFGPVMNSTWLWEMERLWGENVVEAETHSHHLIAFHRRVMETVGLWDENFWPAYFEAEDYSYRMRQVGWEGGWRRVSVNALSTRVAGHLRYVHCPADPLLAYRERKWGGPKMAETFTLPFGDMPLGYWPAATIPELAERYGYGPRGELWW